MPDEQTTIGLPGGFNVPLPKWTTTFFGIIAVVAISFGIYRYFFPAVPELVSAKQANDALQLEVNHYNLHIVDTPLAVLEDDLDHNAAAAAHAAHVSLRIFADGCLLISRKVGEMSNTRLLVETKAPPARVTWTPTLPPVVATVLAEGRCLNSHPGPFKSGYGQKADACWVQVIRRWDDGCAHVQMFNTCNGTWATNADGSPKVQWTRCVH
jgi:hypothetical protein